MLGMSRTLRQHGWQVLWVAAICIAALQLAFLLQIIAWRWFEPSSTSFERAAWRQFGSTLRRTPLTENALPDTLKRAVIASEDARFFEHDGVDWQALEKAWSNNQSHTNAKANTRRRIKGGSTLTQQLGKNLFLSSERSYLRKAQELVLTFWIELLWDKPRILAAYLNAAEFGSGIYGAEAAAQRYWGIHANQLDALRAARLAVMLPNPKFFEKHSNSAYLQRQTQVIMARMGDVDLP